MNKVIYQHDHRSFEEVGNYIYSISKRELKKVALGLNMPTIAVYYYNDCYEIGVEYEKANDKSSLFKKVKRKIAMSDWMCKLGLITYSSMIGIIFKEEPCEQQIFELKSLGFEIILLPKNPYIPPIKNPDLNMN